MNEKILEPVSKQASAKNAAGAADTALAPQPLPEPPDFELSIGIDSPADSTVLHPSELPFTVRGSATADQCVVEKVEIRLGAAAAFQAVTPAQPGNWSSWSFSGTPVPANGPVRVTAKASGYYMLGAKRVPISSESSILVLLAAGAPVPAFWTLDAVFPAAMAEAASGGTGAERHGHRRQLAGGGEGESDLPRAGANSSR